MMHHIQRTIIIALASVDSSSFTELKPNDIENKLFTYHLKQLLVDDYVGKGEDGRYSLTAFGRKHWNMSIKEKERAKRAFSALYLIIKNDQEQYLLYRRSVHPLKDTVAFMHAVPHYDKTFIESACTQVYEKTGLMCDFAWRGSGYFHTYNRQELESYVHFDMLVCDVSKGVLEPHDEQAEYFWTADFDEYKTELMLHMPRLIELYNSGESFFIDESFQIEA